MTMWEHWQNEVQMSERKAEASRRRPELVHLRELELLATSRSDGRTRRPSREGAARWLVRAAQIAASWLF